MNDCSFFYVEKKHILFMDEIKSRFCYYNVMKGGGNTHNDFKYAKSHILPPNTSEIKILNHRVADENMIK